MHSAAIRIRSAFMPSRIQLKPCPSRPIRLATGTRKLSIKSSVVAWFIMVSIGLMVSPLPSAWRISTSSTDMPSVGRPLSARGAVRTSSTIRSECSVREINTFWPFTTKSSPSRTAVVRMREVSVPLVGSVTPKACNRSLPAAISGSKRRFCSSLPCLSRVPMVYIWAWQAPPLPPLR